MPVDDGSKGNQAGHSYNAQQDQTGAPAPALLVNLAQGPALGTAQGQPPSAQNALILSQALRLGPQPLGQPGAIILPTVDNSSAEGGALNHAAARGFSDQYRGDVFNDRNMSANIPAHQNTSLWMESLPAGCTSQLLLGAVARVASYINPANASDNKPCAAAKIVFFSREGAESLLRASHAGRFMVGGRRPRVTWNRVKTANRGSRDSQKSRVVLMHGPGEYVNQPRLSQWFRRFFKFETEVVIPRDYRINQEGQAVQLLEWRFASTRCQGEAAFMAIGLELRGMVECRCG
ncbi:hypothetical protein LZ30DRAFT_750388 [Colletotrichum cereale]|nr:hypothetical protein LZ30DRAFT_750388 [Colletotrichum cereale]